MNHLNHSSRKLINFTLYLTDSYLDHSSSCIETWSDYPTYRLYTLSIFFIVDYQKFRMIEQYY